MDLRTPVTVWASSQQKPGLNVLVCATVLQRLISGAQLAQKLSFSAKAALSTLGAPPQDD